MSETPLRNGKPTVRRKLVSPKVPNTKIKPICPAPKKPRIQVSNADDNAVDEVISQPKPSVECTPTKLTNDDEDFLSQEISSQQGRGLPRIIWQTQQINSPLLSDNDDTRENDTFSHLKIESPKQKPTHASSTPYLKKIWQGSKTRFQSIASVESSSSKADADKERRGSWINEMYSRVALLEESNSRSPTPDKQSQPGINSQSSQFTKISSKSSIITPPQQTISRFSSNPQSIRGSGSPVIKPPMPMTSVVSQSYPKPDNNSSLFSDSLDEFNGDFTLSDSDDGFQPSQVNPKEALLRPFKELASDKTKNISHDTRSVGTSVTNSTRAGRDGADDTEPVGACNKPIKSEPRAPTARFAASISVKLEPKTPPNKLVSRGSGSPRTPLRRYNSDGIIKSPSTQNTQNLAAAEPAAASPAKTASTEGSTLNLIEEKRKHALSKLKSRKGSLVKHKSLDSATIAARHSQSEKLTMLTQAPAHDTSKQSLKLLIEEKRRLAAEKLHKHREVTKDKSDRLSGSLRQLTPPISQENRGSGGATCSAFAELPSKPNSTFSSSQPAASEKKSIKVSTEVKTESKAVLSSQTNIGSQSSSTFSGKLALDELMDDLESNSPIKPKPPPQRHKESVNMSNIDEWTNLTDTDVMARQSENKPKQPNIAIVQNKQSVDEKTRLIIEQKRKAALEKLKQSKKS